MNKTIQEAEATIEELLEQRRQYEEWLNKLDASGDKAPPAVRQRVRGDYEARLQGVMEQLRGRGAAISEELERHHASQAELDRSGERPKRRWPRRKSVIRWESTRRTSGAASAKTAAARSSSCAIACAASERRSPASPGSRASSARRAAPDPVPRRRLSHRGPRRVPKWSSRLPW